MCVWGGGGSFSKPPTLHPTHSPLGQLNDPPTSTHRHAHTHTCTHTTQPNVNAPPHTHVQGEGPSFDGALLLAPYPALAPLQTRRLNARKFATTYCYDFPSVFENSLKEVWALYAVNGEWRGVGEGGGGFGVSLKESTQGPAPTLTPS